MPGWDTAGCTDRFVTWAPGKAVPKPRPKTHRKPAPRHKPKPHVKGKPAFHKPKPHAKHH